jgi:hypothetical protein
MVDGVIFPSLEPSGKGYLVAYQYLGNYSVGKMILKIFIIKA